MPKATILHAEQCQTVTADWGSLTWYACGELGNSDEMTVGKCIIKAGCENPVHTHPNCSEILVVQQGRISHRIEDGKEVEMGPGDVITVPPHLTHNARTLSEEDAVLFIAFSSAHREAAPVKPAEA